MYKYAKFLFLSSTCYLSQASPALMTQAAAELLLIQGFCPKNYVQLV